MNHKRGQGAFEYILMLSGVLLVVILIVFILQNTLSNTNGTLSSQSSIVAQANNASIVRLYPGKNYNLVVYEKTGNVNSTAYPCCTWNSSVGCSYPPCTTSNSGLNGWGNVSCDSRYFDVKNGRCV